MEIVRVVQKKIERVFKVKLSLRFLVEVVEGVFPHINF